MQKLKKITISQRKLLISLLIFISIVTILYFGSSILLSLIVGLLIAILLNRPMMKLINWGVPRWLAITLSVLLLLFIFSVISSAVAWQVGNIAEDWDEIERKATEKLTTMSNSIERSTGVKPENTFDVNNFRDEITSFASSMLVSFSTILTQSFIILIYIIVLLMQKRMFKSFLYRIVDNDEKQTMDDLISKVGEVVSRYLIGKGKIMVILFVLYGVGFWIGDVPYALFLALFAALFSIIPYIGNFIGGGAAVILSYLYSGLTPALIVVAVISLAQLLENYVLTPYIIGDEIDLNPFMTIFGVIAFSALWGIAGAVISLPIIGALRVAFKHIKGMENYAFLLEKHED